MCILHTRFMLHASFKHATIWSSVVHYFNEDSASQSMAVDESASLHFTAAISKPLVGWLSVQGREERWLTFEELVLTTSLASWLSIVVSKNGLKKVNLPAKQSSKSLTGQIAVRISCFYWMMITFQCISKETGSLQLPSVPRRKFPRRIQGPTRLLGYAISSRLYS